MSSKLLTTSPPVSHRIRPGPNAQVVPRRIPVYQPSLSGREKEYVNDCLDTNWISSRGSYINRFEKGFGEFVGLEHCTSVCNGTAAVQVALAALGIGPGDEVIVPSFTYIASVNTIVAVGATPVFAEIEESTWQVDPASIESLITPRTKAIVVVHLYGNACDMKRICSLSSAYRLALIEDCAESFGTTIDGQHTGTFGDVATFSFFGNKTITTGEGGMVVCRDAALLRKCVGYKTQGVSPTRTYWHDAFGFNFRMTNIEAAIGLAQLERAGETIQRKIGIGSRYQKTLRGLPIDFADVRAGVTHSQWMVSFTLREAEKRDALRGHLDHLGIETRPFFWPAHVLPMYKDRGCALAISDRVSASGINVPSWPGLTDDDIAYVCDGIRSFFGSDAAPA